MDDTILAYTYLLELQRKWQKQDEGALMMYALSFLEVKSLVEKENVNKTWPQLTKDIRHHPCKVWSRWTKAFQSKQKLREAVHMDIPWTNGMFLK
jgi:hypothetical protein